MPRKCMIDSSVCGLWRPKKPEAYSVCFPSPIAIGASGDPEIAYEMASLIAQSAAEERIPLLLTPVINRVSSRTAPEERGLCFSDDLEINRKMLVAWTKGLQDFGVGAVMHVLPSEDPDEQKMARQAVCSAKICAIHTVDGNMPTLAEARKAAKAYQKRPEEFDWGMQHHQARKLARRGIVLLKNENRVLPIHGNPKIAMIGEAAETPCFRSTGLPPIVCTETLSALQAVRSVSPVRYEKGYHGGAVKPDEGLIRAAVSLAAESDLALVFLHAEGSEAFVLSLPASQEQLLLEVSKVQPKTVAVLHTDRPVELPWLDRIPALAVAFPGGQAGGAAVIDLLFGAVPFTGKLPVSFPVPEFHMGFGLI